MLSFLDIVARLREIFGEAAIADSQPEAKQPFIQVQPEYLAAICQWLRDTPECYIDFLASITGVDYGNGMLGAVYHLRSIPHGHELVLKANTSTAQPHLPSVSHIWRAADWHEREAYDLLGITFAQHPDLRRILLPDDWQGFPLRKDYQAQDTYHGVKVKYESGTAE